MSPATDPASRLFSLSADVEPQGRSGTSAGRAVVSLIDALIIGVLLAFAIWTVLYHLALVDLIPSEVAFYGWLVFLIPAGWATARLGWPWIRTWDSAPLAPQMILGILAAAGAAVMVRPDLDDASYVVRSTWVAEHGDVNFGDVIFTDNFLGPLAGQNTYLPSIEALFGWVSRSTGLSTAHVVYGIFPPVAGFAAVWALGMVFRGWQARRPVWCLALAALFLAWGGRDHASWGNLSIGRIWQGKIVMLAVLVPLLYGILGFLLRTVDRRLRWVGMAVVGTVGIGAVGLTSSALFVIPGICFLGLIAAISTDRWRQGVAIFVVGSIYPVLAAIATALSISLGWLAIPNGADPWTKVLGEGISKWIVLVAFGLAIGASIWPSGLSGVNAPGRAMVLASLGVAALIAVNASYQIAVGILGTDAIAWRLTWIVPVPALVGLLAALPWRWPFASAIPLACGVSLMVWGLPIWSSDNAGAGLAAPFGWKMFPADVQAAEWIASQQPTGAVLAPVGVGAALGVLTSRFENVGSRGDYMAIYASTPEALMEVRAPLQRLAEGSIDSVDIDGTADRLAVLDVQIGCFRDASTTARTVLEAAGFVAAYSASGITCLTSEAK